MKTLLTLLLFIFIVNEIIAQQELIAPDIYPKRLYKLSTPGQKKLKSYKQYKIPGKRASQYTPEDWGSIIDSTWGPGQSANVQYGIFDSFWSRVDQQWAGFPNLPIDWNSVRNLYRPQIGNGLSRGRFYSLMSRMWLELSELHTWVTDMNVDTTFGYYTFNYRPGVPLLCIGSWLGNMLGVAVTPLSDSTNLVYRVAPDNPLGLEPGDLVLGYEGIPWKLLYQQLLEAGLPVSYIYSWSGTTPESKTHFFLMAVGCNWGLFDTIDVVKYSSGDTLHLSTALLDTTVQTIWPSDQVPVAGVPMPEGPYSAVAVSWGVVQGTNIGYIYVWDWISNESRLLFQSAVTDLLQNQRVVGLVVDFRMNWGGDPSYSYGGFAQLFNFDPTPNLSRAYRNSQTNHMSFNFYGTIWGNLNPTTLYDHPIAILIGPGSFSAGDICALYLSYHPMAHLFGKPTNGAFVGDNYTAGTISGVWPYQVPTSVLYSNVPDTGFLIHKGLEPNEVVWLTRDGVANGEDAVVESALEWMTNLAYAHDVSIPKAYSPPGDSVHILAIVENPNQHDLKVNISLDNFDLVTVDSSALFNDGLHGDGEAGDSLWACYYAPNSEETYLVSVTTEDSAAGTIRTLPHIGSFTSAGPVVCDGYYYLGIAPAPPYPNFSFKLALKNMGLISPARSVTAEIIPSDTSLVKFIVHNNQNFGDIQPGVSKMSPTWYTCRVDSIPQNIVFDFQINIYSDDYLFWQKDTSLVVGIKTIEAFLPLSYELYQNYPNPFNPTTAIKFDLPKTSQVTLKIYNILGEEVATLVSDQLVAGSYQYGWDASGVASGVYLYRLEAEGFVETRKMVLMR